MHGSPTRRLAVLAVVSAMVATAAARTEHDAADQAPSAAARQEPSRTPVPTTSMPNLVGMQLGEARDQPVVVKFRLVLNPQTVESSQYRPGTIARQSVPAGKAVTAGTSIVVYVATGGLRVPPVEDQPVDVARAILQKAGFRAKVSTVVTSQSRPGIVQRQDPKPGTTRPRDSVVVIEVSVAPPSPPTPPNPDNSGPRRPPDRPPDDVNRWTLVPELVGLEANAARALVSKAGLEPRVRRERSNGRAGTVISQDPAPRTRVLLGTRVDIVEASPPDRTPPPPPPPTYLMPDLVGRTADEARANDIVRQIKLRVTSRDDAAATGRPGFIVRQSISAGSVINPGDLVTVWIATGVRVPDVVGLDADAARRQLGSAGLQAQAREVVRDRNAGQVIEQSPAAGTLVARGGAVEISVAALEMVIVPDVGQRDRANATSLLAARRLTSVFINDQESELPPGLVFSQEPAAGSRVAVGTTVRMRMPLGVVVPYVVNSTSGQARDRLAATGLKTEVREVRTDRSGMDVVLEQVPAAGQRVTRGTSVVVSVARAPLVRVPDVTRRSREDATRLVDGAKLRSAFSNDEASEFDPGLVTAQEPAAGSEVEAGTVVRLRVATGVLVPDVVGSNPDDAQARARESGLAATVTEVRTDAARSGTVFEQKPGARQRVARGSTLQLSVARTPLAVVPNLIERTRAEATDTARAARLAVTFEEDRDSTLSPDRVSRQDPAAGASVEIGTTMRVAVATGVAVPDVSGVPVATARGRLEAAGLRAGEEREVTAGTPESTVLRQSPQAAVMVARGSVVRLVVAALQTVVTTQPAQTPAATTSTAGRLRALNLTSILPALVGVGLFSLVVYRFVKANRGSLEQKEEGGEAPPAPDVALDPRAGDLVTRLEVSGAGLVDFEVRLRVGADSGQQSLAVDGPLLDSEKRIYE